MRLILEHIFKFFPLIFLRYIVIAGGAFLIFYIWRRERYAPVKIQAKYPERANMRREFLYSILSLMIFASVGGMVYWLSMHGYTQIYRDFHAHSVGYFIFSVVAFILIHDTYFYWMHRFMHWDKIYKYVHRIHHLSTNPTPWAAFAFHPVEAVLEVAILPIMVFLMPLHVGAIFIWVMYQTLLNVMGHLGFELFPSGFTTHMLTRWHNTSVHHNMHHRLVRCNYGLYYNVWDRIMGTNHAKYTEEFEKVKTNAEKLRYTEPETVMYTDTPEVSVQ